MKIYLARHTEYENPKGVFAFHLPVYLSKEGRRNASRMGKWLLKRGLRGVEVVSSPIVRCVQTAELIASETGSFVRVDKRLVEVACPNLQGKKKPKDRSWILEQDDKSREPKKELIKRTTSIFREKVRVGNDCILVSHGEPIFFLYFHLVGKEIPRYPWSPENKSIVVQKGEVVELEVKKGKLVRAEKFSPLLG